MSKQTQWISLGALLAILGAVLYLNRSGPIGQSAALADMSEARIITVDNPQLQIHKIKQAQEWKYEGSRRNIFTATPPPPPAAQVKAAEMEANRLPSGPPPPPPPPPVVLPVKFFGYTADTHGNHRRAFFTNGEEVYIAGEGEIVLGHYRVLRIRNDSVVFEDTAVGRTGTQPISEEGGPSA